MTKWCSSEIRLPYGISTYTYCFMNPTPGIHSEAFVTRTYRDDKSSQKIRRPWGNSWSPLLLACSPSPRLTFRVMTQPGFVIARLSSGFGGPGSFALASRGGFACCACLPPGFGLRRILFLRFSLALTLCELMCTHVLISHVSHVSFCVLIVL